MPETSANRPAIEDVDDDDDDRSRPLTTVIAVAVGVVVVAVFVIALVAFRAADSDAEVTLPSDLPTLPTTSTTSTTSAVVTTAAPVVTTTPTSVVPTITVFPGRTTTTEPDDDGGGDDETTTTTRHSSDRRAALREYADDIGARIVSDVASIGSTDYALLVVGGDGQLASWDGESWTYAERVPTPSAITDVEVDDVTGDGADDFVVRLSGLDRPGGVYSRATFDFDFLPFNSLSGRVEFIDGLTLVPGGGLESPFRDGNGSRTLDWRWTGRMFEAR